ncbi:MAG: ABC transporter ATP-binding protein [Bacteroidota bacterium]
MHLSIQNLNKTYRNGVKALQNLNLDISSGMFGLLGPNGAGKSSLMRTIATLQEPDSGHIFLNELNIFHQPTQLRKVLGYLPQSFGVYPGISAEGLLDYLAILKGLHDKKNRKRIIQEVLELTNLYDVRKRHASTYSGGMKQRFGIAQLLLNRPQLIIVDEPTAGLDPSERKRFLNLLLEISHRNIVLFSTHIVDDVRDLCQDMAIMNHGQVLLRDTPLQCLDRLKGKVWEIDIPRQDLADYQQSYQVLSHQFRTVESISVRIYADRCPDPRCKAAEIDLEDVYFHTLQTI